MFRISSSNGARLRHLPYDYWSVMHFQRTQFSKNMQLLTLDSLNANVPSKALGSSHFPTRLDYLHIIFLYCEGTRLHGIINTSLVIFSAEVLIQVWFFDNLQPKQIRIDLCQRLD